MSISKKHPISNAELPFSLRERVMDHNCTYQIALFKKLKEQFLDLVAHQNKREFLSKTNILIATLLSRTTTPISDCYERAKEVPFCEAPYEVRIALAKEIGSKHPPRRPLP